MSKLIIDTTSGDITERDLTKAEIDQQKIDESIIDIAKAEELQKLEAIDSGRAKLASLGLNEQEIDALLGKKNVLIS